MRQETSVADQKGNQKQEMLRKADLAIHLLKMSFAISLGQTSMRERLFLGLIRKLKLEIIKG